MAQTLSTGAVGYLTAGKDSKRISESQRLLEKYVRYGSTGGGVCDLTVTLENLRVVVCNGSEVFRKDLNPTKTYLGILKGFVLCLESCLLYYTQSILDQRG
jgi:hypothetical protein